MKKLLSIALSLILTLQASAQAQSGRGTDSNAQNGKERHFDIASHLRQLKITEMNNQARMKREQQSAALRTTAPVRKSPDSMQPKTPASMKSKAPVSMQPKAPARKASPVASAKPKSAANNGGFWKYKEKLDYILEENEENGQIKRTFEYDYDGIVTKEFSYRLQSDKTWSLEDTYEYEYEDNVIKSEIHYYDYWDGLIPNSKTKTTYVRMPSGDSREFNRYQWNGDDWVVETPETTVEYDGEGRLTYYESPRTGYKIEYYYDENGDYHDKAQYTYIYNIEQFICTYLVTLDENNRVISKEEYNITDWETGERQGNYKYEYAYDENGNTTKNTTYNWNYEAKDWYVQNESQYTFDTNVLVSDITMKDKYRQGTYKLLKEYRHEYNYWEQKYYDYTTEYFYSVFGYYYHIDGESHELIPDGDGFVDEDFTLLDKQAYSANTDFTVGNLTYKRTFVDSEWNSLYVPFSIPVESLDEKGLQAAEILTVHVYDDDQDGTVDHTTIEVVPVISGALEANVPYVVRAKELEGEKEVEITLTDALVLKSDNNSIDCSSTKQLFTFTGSYEPISGETLFNDGLYYLGIDSETSHVSIVKAESEETKSLPAQRWSLAITDRKGNPVDSHVRAIDIIMDENATGIAAVGIGSESETDVYNVAGVRVATLSAGQSIKSIALPAGVYVSKGHKFIIK